MNRCFSDQMIWMIKGEKEMKKIKGILAIIGLVVVLGAAGSEQINVISFGQAIKQCLIGLPMFVIGVW